MMFYKVCALLILAVSVGWAQEMVLLREHSYDLSQIVSFPVQKYSRPNNITYHGLKMFTHEGNSILGGLNANWYTKKVHKHSFDDHNLYEYDYNTENTTMVSTGTYGFEYMAQDYATGNMYFVNTDGVYVMDDRFRYTKRILKSETDNWRFSALAVDVVRRKMLFSFYNAADTTTSEIYQANFDGSDIDLLFNISGTINNLMIHYTEKRIYWTSNSKVMSATFRGTNKRTILTATDKTYFGIAYYGNYLYVTDIEPDSNNKYQMYVVRLYKNRNRNPLVYSYESNFSSPYIVYYGPRTEYGDLSTKHSCTDSSCDQLCLPTSKTTHKCQCIDNWSAVDGKCYHSSVAMAILESRIWRWNLIGSFAGGIGL